MRQAIDLSDSKPWLKEVKTLGRSVTIESTHHSL